MKRWIHAVTKHPIDDLSIRREFDRIWKFTDEDVEAFLGDLDHGYGNSDLSPVLLELDFHDMMDLAEQYAQYKQAKADRQAHKHTFDIEGASRTVEKLVDEYSNGTIVAEYSSKKNKKSHLEVKYALYPKNEPSRNSITITINVYPDVEFRVDSELETYIRDDVNRLMYTTEMTDLFVDHYLDFLDEFYGKYLGISANKYKDYIEITYRSGDRDSLVVWFTYCSDAKMGHLLFEKGYITDPYSKDAEAFLEPLFESYGLNIKHTYYFLTDVDSEMNGRQ